MTKRFIFVPFAIFVRLLPALNDLCIYLHMYNSRVYTKVFPCVDLSIFILIHFCICYTKIIRNAYTHTLSIRRKGGRVSVNTGAVGDERSCLPFSHHTADLSQFIIGSPYAKDT